MTKIILYYANWCGHCKNFKPIWDSIKEFLKEHNVECLEYEDEKDNEVMEKNGINGFPTIRILKNGEEYEYVGPREPESIIQEVLDNVQMGGTKSKKYYIKYY